MSTKDNVKLTKQLSERFKRPVSWNEYKTKIDTRNLNNQNPTKFILMLIFKELKDFLFLLLIILIIMQTKLEETAIENILNITN